MTGYKALALSAALAAASVASASAELVLESVHWQVGRVERGRVVSWQDVKVIGDRPPVLDERLRARIVLKNRGPKPAEGILLLYSMTTRLAPSDAAGAEGSWAIPFVVEEKRVPAVGPNKVMDVPLEVGDVLSAHVKRLSRSGWWPDRVKLQVMLAPHAGVKSIQTVEDVIEVRP